MTAVPGGGYEGGGCLMIEAAAVGGSLITGVVVGWGCLIMRDPSSCDPVLLLCGASWRFPDGPGTAGGGDCGLDFFGWGPFPGMLFLRYGGLAF